MKHIRTCMSVFAVFALLFSACHNHSPGPGPVEPPAAVPFSKLYGGSNDDVACKTIRSKDGYITVGITYSSDSGIVNFHGGADILVVSIDNNGN